MPLRNGCGKVSQYELTAVLRATVYSKHVWVQFQPFKPLSCKVNGTGAALTTEELMLGFAEPQSVSFTSSLRLRGLFLLLLWPSVHWYSQHGDSINTADHLRARVVFSDRGGFHSSHTVFLTSSQKDELVPEGSFCPTYSAKAIHVIKGHYWVWQMNDTAGMAQSITALWAKNNREKSIHSAAVWVSQDLNTLSMALPQPQGVLLLLSL